MNLVMMAILIKASTKMTLQGEVVSEMLDVDEVEEAFAKMRRAAGVRMIWSKMLSSFAAGARIIQIFSFPAKDLEN